MYSARYYILFTPVSKGYSDFQSNAWAGRGHAHSTRVLVGTMARPVLIESESLDSEDFRVPRTLGLASPLRLQRGVTRYAANFHINRARNMITRTAPELWPRRPTFPCDRGGLW
jgi:hypothetical protein